MLKLFYPCKYEDSVFSIDYGELYANGYRGIIFDIDNTLVPHGKNSTKEVDDLFQSLHSMGLKTMLLSNNSEERIKRFVKNIDSSYIHSAQKPRKTNYYKALDMMNLEKEEAIFIGDQIFTDIVGANRSGIDNILVKYIRPKNETKIGIRRNLENIILKFYNPKKRSKKKDNKLNKESSSIKRFLKREILFCDINPACYAISLRKEISKRHINNMLSNEKIAKTLQSEKLSNIITEYSSNLIKRGKGIDLRLQENKAVNIDLACNKISGMIIRPGEVFSFWSTVGNTTKRKGYLDGRVIERNVIKPGIGGGLCNLVNTIHLLILHSPLEVTEFHSHSDALAPDEGKRIPFSSGTSIVYNHLDYRFKNNTDQLIQLLLWCDDEKLYGELRSENEFPWSYELIEEDHHFKKEGERYYRNSKIYKETIDKVTAEIIDKKLVLDNHSEVMFEYDLIPENQIRN